MVRITGRILGRWLGRGSQGGNVLGRGDCPHLLGVGHKIIKQSDICDVCMICNRNCKGDNEVKKKEQRVGDQSDACVTSDIFDT